VYAAYQFEPVTIKYVFGPQQYGAVNNMAFHVPRHDKYSGVHEDLH
jgi:hypothetical protein